MNISSDDLIFRRAVIQLLDVENGNFEAARELLFLKNDIMELLRKQLVYIMQADEVKRAKWNKDSKVMNRIEQMNENNDEAFIRTSAEIAEELYDIMCDSADIPSADLLCLSFQIAGSLYCENAPNSVLNSAQGTYYICLCHRQEVTALI